MAAALDAMAIDAEPAPLLTVRPIEGAFAALGPEPIQAILFTSGAGVAIAAAHLPRDRPVLAVGAATAEAAAAAGFNDVLVAAGDGEALAELARKRLRPDLGRLVHVAGRHRAVDLQARLGAHGFRVDLVEAYEALDADGFPPGALEALRADAVDAVVVASARTAAALRRSWISAGLPAPAGRPAVVAISDAAAEPVRGCFDHVVVAAAPDGESLTKAVVALRGAVEKNGVGSGPHEASCRAAPNRPSRSQPEERTAMASETDDKRTGGGGAERGFDSRGRRKGKPTTLDLTATEVPPGAETADTTTAAPVTTGTAADAPIPGDAPLASDTSTAAPSTAGDASTVERPASAETTPGSADGPGAADAPDTTGGAFGSAADADRAAAGATGASSLHGSSGHGSSGHGTAAHDPSAAPDRRRSGGLGAFAAALLGGVVALGGGAALMASGVLSPYLSNTADTTAVSDLEGRVADLGSQLAALENRPAPEAPAPDPAIGERLAALETAVRNLPAAPTGPDPAVEELRTAVADLRAAIDGMAPVREEVAGLSERLNAVDARPVPADPAPRLDEIARALDGLRATDEAQRAALERLTAATARPVVEPGRVDALQADLDRLGQSLATLDANLNQRVGSLDGNVTQRLGTLNTAVGELKGQVEGTVADLRTRVDAAVADVDSRVNAAVEEIRTAVAPVDQRVGALETRIANEPAAATVAALSLAVTTLASKVNAGEPFATDLAVIENTGTELPDLGPLKANAETGVETTSDLVRTFPVDAILDARPMDPNVGVWDRVVDGAKSLVNYREAGETATDPLSEPLDRTQGALAAGDLAGAQAAWADLPDWAKAASADWKAKLDARVAVDQTVATLTDQTMSRLQPQTTGTAQ